MSDEKREPGLPENENLRDRIAAAASSYFRESGAYFDHYNADNCTINGDLSLLDLADAVIAELGLRREDNGRLGVSAPYRYVTDWKADDE